MNKEKAAVPALLKIIKAALIACALGVALVAVFAFVMQKRILDIEAVPYVNAGIKLVCALAAALIACRGANERALVLGGISAGAYMFVSFIVFSLISGGFSFGTSLMLDFGICILAGMVMGMIHNLRS